jgi:hypothetical protein
MHLPKIDKNQKSGHETELQKTLIPYLDEPLWHSSHKKMPIDLLAYLWIAVDCRMNIIVVGEDEEYNHDLASQISWLIDRLDKVLIIEGTLGAITESGSEKNIVYLYGKRYPVKGSLSALEEAPDTGAEWIIVDRIKGKGAFSLFQNATHGIQFISSIRGNYSTNQIIELFQAKSLPVNPEHLSMLDISIHTDSRKERGIFEYRWLSRAEIESGNVIWNGDSVKISRISSLESINHSALPSSKAIERFAVENGIATRLALSEFEIRKRLISGIYDSDPYTFNFNISKYLSKFMI